MKVTSIAMLVTFGLASSAAFAHSADQIIIRGGPVYVHPQDKSDHVKVVEQKAILKPKLIMTRNLG